MIAKIFGSKSGDSSASDTPPATVQVPTTKPDAAAVPPTSDQATVEAGSQPVGVGSVEQESEVAPTKMDKATEVYRRLYKKKGATRKEIVAAFVDEVGLTTAGAATYYQLIKKRRH